MSDLAVKLIPIDEKTRLRATSRDNPEIIIDYFPPVGTGKGYNSMELFLLSFGSCVSTTLLSVLRYKRNKTVLGIETELEGELRKTHPKSFEHILLRLKINAEDLTEAEVREILRNLEDKLCPAWAMIKGNVAVSSEIEIL